MNYEWVFEDMKLANDLPWVITLSIGSSIKGQNLETFSREIQGKDHGERLVGLLCKPLLFFCFLCKYLSPCILLKNSINLMLHISCALSHNAFSLMHESRNYDSTNYCHNLFIFIHLMLASFSLVEILRAVTIKVQTNRKRKFLCCIIHESWNNFTW